MSADLLIRKTARISSCGAYRYRLTREWGPGPLLPFVMLNPSVADAEVDDPTIRRCMGFARREGAGGIVVGNLFAFRATNPGDLPMWTEEAVGPDNERATYEIVREAIEGHMPIICAWGAHRRGLPNFLVQALEMRSARFVCLGKTANGSPRHPLYVKADQPFEPFPAPLPAPTAGGER